MNPDYRKLFYICDTVRLTAQQVPDNHETCYFHPFLKGGAGVLVEPWEEQFIEHFPDKDFYFVYGFRGELSHAWIDHSGIALDGIADQFDDNHSKRRLPIMPPFIPFEFVQLLLS